ncbi:hypothetical protein LTSERUB_3013 [Salmonella enterica subsp. enterica serovar Rubislaw str. A4-653]|uniref:Uncharacterized protein n=1 Tax=Salmonella enterica subsp. enterica serovar Rubislaw str. A4-653 TaxID=913081 RepID=G5QK35_SALRU|nr:hypothetical protein LTSERUB_3013 [Salmonella enterica subsp. enterica serovar Rubislaw str. A4-653]
MEKGVGHCHNQPVYINAIDNHYQDARPYRSPTAIIIINCADEEKL